MATLFVDKLDPQSGTALEIGTSGDTITIPSGATLVNSGTATGFGMTEVDQWRLTTDLSCSTANTNTTVTANLERNDTAGFDKIGTGMSESSGIFTFPSTGVWRVEVLFYFYSSSGGSAYNALNIWTTINDSAYTQQTDVSVATSTTPKRNVGYATTLFDVTSTSNCKVKFMYYCEGTLNLQGDSTKNETHFVFTKLADT